MGAGPRTCLPCSPEHHGDMVRANSFCMRGLEGMPGFWDWRERTQTATAAELAVEDTPLEPVELYTTTAMVYGMVEPEGRRMSDILNSSSQLPIRDPRSTSMVNGVPGTDGDGWTSVATEDILVVMPPEHVSPRQLRVNRRQHRVRINTGPYVVIGNAHLPPGVGLDAYALQRRLRFLAVTNAVIYSNVDPALERMAKVVLVNISPIQELTEVLTIS